ncbi:MAG: adenylate/guanylate cyclase domain-containing protein, partial [Bacteroidota bacterium]
DALKCLEAVKNTPPDLILMDWEMPGMTGVEAIKKLKADPETAEIPVIMVTAYSYPELLEEAFEAGAHDYIKKPVNATELKARVKSTLNLYQSIKTIKTQSIKIENQYHELEKLALVAEKTSHSFIITNPIGEVEWVNKGFRYIHEQSLEDCVNLFGKYIFDFSTFDKFKDTFFSVLETKKEVDFTTQIKTNGKAQKWVHVSLTPIISNGNVARMVAIETDISKLKEKESELNAKNKKLKLLTRYLGKANSKLELQKEEINHQKAAVEAEKQKADNLLLNILPYEVALQLKSKGEAKPRNYRMVSVLFADFKSFSRNSLTLDPRELVSILDEYFKKFDEIIEPHNLEKIKTIGDAYMCAGGLPLRNKSNPINAVLAGIQIQDYMNKINDQKILNNEQIWELRLGIHTGPVIAGVVGSKKFAYDIWGKTVNIASRMESIGHVGMVNISGNTYQHVKEYFDCVYRGKIEARNIGKIDMYFVNSLKPQFAADESGVRPNKAFRELLRTI